MASTDDALATIALLIVNKKLNRQKRRPVKEWLKKRVQYSHVNLLNELKVAPKDFHNYLRMNEDTYLRLLSLVTPLIEKQNTVMKEAISPHHRLSATLRFLATGRSYEDLKYSTVISPQALGYIIPETCDAIYKVLHGDYIKFPQTKEDWRNIAKMFEDKLNFPHCLGAMDGKHIDIIPPSGSGSYFYNYKHRHSMILLAIVDANYRFIMCDFGTNGRVSDGGVLQNTKFFEKLEKKLLKIPYEENVGTSSRNLPYVFVVDDAFPLRSDMMKPFRQANLNTHERKVYNYRICRARRIVENAFGIMASRFRIFHTQINLEPRNIESVVMASCALHNFLLTSLPSSYAPPECFDNESIIAGSITPGFDTIDSNMERLNSSNAGNIAYTAKQIRENFIEYFMNEGRVPWQDNFAN